MKKTKLICTIGPSTDNLNLLAQMMSAGMDLALLDFSRGNHEEQGKRLQLVQEAAAKCGKPVATIAAVRNLENHPSQEEEMPFLSEQEEKNILFAARHGMDFLTVAGVEKAQDILAIRRVVEQEGLQLGIIAEIATKAGVEQIAEISNVANGVLLDRLALGEDFAAETVPLVQKKLVAHCNQVGIPVITAGQMLQSLVTGTTATRTETSDIANAIFDGTDVLLLKEETATGKHPLEAVQALVKIAEATEKALPYDDMFKRKGLYDHIHSTDAVSHATVQIAQEIDCDAILAITESGFTAKMVSKYKPQCPIIAISRMVEGVRAMQIYWGVIPILGPFSADTDEMIELSIKCALDAGVLQEGATIVVSAGIPIATPGNTNMIKVVTVGTALVNGKGIGRKCVTGKICNCLRATDYQEKLKKGDILVVDALDKDFVQLVSNRASAIIAEEAGLTSTTAIVGITGDIPVVVGAAQATALLWDGQTVTVDPVSGVVYEGTINL